VKIAQEIASVVVAEIDHHILTWVLDAPDEDYELEQFFETGRRGWKGRFRVFLFLTLSSNLAVVVTGKSGSSSVRRPPIQHRLPSDVL
jgi:hypothetical protein